MQALDVIIRAQQLMKDDAHLVSFKEDTFFWNENMNGLSGQERQNFNRFYELDTIDVSLLKPIESGHLEKIFTDHTEMTQELRDALALNPNKKDHMKLVMATQFSFMLIMLAAFKGYGGL